MRDYTVTQKHRAGLFGRLPIFIRSHVQLAGPNPALQNVKPGFVAVASAGDPEPQAAYFHCYAARHRWSRSVPVQDDNKDPAGTVQGTAPQFPSASLVKAI